MLKERYYRTTCCEFCEDKEREMSVKFDDEKREIVLRLDVNKLSLVVQSLEMMVYHSHSERRRTQASEMISEIHEAFRSRS